MRFALQLIWKEFPLNVVTKPYLAALKLRSTGYKDSSDIVTLVSLMTGDEKEKLLNLQN